MALAAQPWLAGKTIDNSAVRDAQIARLKQLRKQRNESEVQASLAAITTACRGVSTLVATIVAIELAVSWNPLMYSNTNARVTALVLGLSNELCPSAFHNGIRSANNIPN